MKSKLSGKVTLGTIAAALAIAVIPLIAQADEQQAEEIASLKKQIYNCHHHKKHHHRASSCVLPTKTTDRSFEKQTVIEKPVVVEKVVEKQVVVKEPAETQVILERPVELERKVVVEHSAHHKHLFHFGIPFIGVNLF